MVRSTSFKFIPVLEPEFPKGVAGGVGTLPAEYFLADNARGNYNFTHKFTLVSDPVTGTSLQILTPDANGDFTAARPENKFPIENQFIKIQLIDINGDGSEYKFRLTASTLTTPMNKVVLPAANRPNFVISETQYSNGINTVTELNFIGSIDIRAGFSSQVRVVVSPGNEVEICAVNGDLVFQY